VTALDPRWRRAERIRERVLELLEGNNWLSARALTLSMFDLFPGRRVTRDETARALSALRMAGKVVYQRAYGGEFGVWRLA